MKLIQQSKIKCDRCGYSIWLDYPLMSKNEIGYRIEEDRCHCGGVFVLVEKNTTRPVYSYSLSSEVRGETGDPDLDMGLAILKEMQE